MWNEGQIPLFLSLFTKFLWIPNHIKSGVLYWLLQYNATRCSCLSEIRFSERVHSYWWNCERINTIQCFLDLHDHFIYNIEMSVHIETGWMASLTPWTWVWVNSGSWWWTGRPGVLRFMGLQRVGHDWVTHLIWSESRAMGAPGLFPLG